MIAVINDADLEGLGKDLKLKDETKGNTEFECGLPATFYVKQGNDTNTVTIRKNEQNNNVEISFGETSAWSLFYDGTLTITPATGWIVKNTYNPKINIDVTKVWNHKENKEKPTSVQVQLYAGGDPVNGALLTLQSNDADSNKNWKGTFENLPKYYNDNTEIQYTVQEIKVPGYDSSVEGNVENGFIITNTYNAQQPEELSFDFHLSKVVEQSGNVVPGKQTFTFELVDAEGKAPAAYGIDIDAITVPTDGVGCFGTRVYGTVDPDKVHGQNWQQHGGENSYSDVYYSCTFTLKENNGGVAGWTYSNEQYSVEICYYPNPDSANGSASACVYLNGDRQNGASFTNTYSATSAPESKPESKPIRDTVTIEIGNNEKTEEANPDTGAPLMFAPVMVAALAAAVVVKRKK